MAEPKASPLELMVKVWPLILAIVTLVAGWTTMRSQIEVLEAREAAAELRVAKLEVGRDEDRKELAVALEGVRNALGRQQLTLARICVLVSKGVPCD